MSLSLIEKAARRLEELRRIDGDADSLALPHSQTIEQGVRKAAGDSSSAAVRDAPAIDLPRTAAGTARNAVTPSAGPFLDRSSVRRSREVMIDLVRLARDGYITPDAPRSQLADEFRVLKRPLLANAKGRSAAPIRRANLIMVTSSLPSEGKTFTSINLAMSLAMEVDSTALLVDADVARPALLGRLGLPPSAGLLDLLTRPELDVSEVMLRSDIEGLSILPAGSPHPRATELLASEGMARLLEDLATRYSDRVVVFDAPPLLVSTESRALAAQMGQVLLVVEADRTAQSVVKQALAAIESCPVVMTILNRAQPTASNSYYGHYGLYGE